MMTLEEALPKLLERHIGSHSPNEMVAVLQSAINGIRDMQAYETANAPVCPNCECGVCERARKLR